MKISFQSIYNKAWAAFIVGDDQPGFNMVEHCCSYKDANGNKCAVGLDLPEGHPAQKSRQTLAGLAEKYSDLFDDQIVSMTKSIDGEEKLVNFQFSLHDNLIDYSTGQWDFTKEERRQKYIEIAKAFNLIIPGESDDPNA
jgi:hypothetical protein